MANPYTDPRYEMARLMRAQNTAPSTAPTNVGPAPSKAGVTLGRTASNMVAANPSLRERVEAIASGKAPRSQAGVMGAVFDNPLSKAVLKPLEILGIPGKAIVSGLREYADAADSDPNTKASFSDFFTQTKDPTFGFGKAFNPNTGYIWLDRAIGFAGDVALDPLTYATFGAGKFAGYSGRLDMANAVLRQTGDEALANSVQRFGRAAIKDPAILESIGANRHGIYFLGKRIKVGKNGQGLRLPGSSALGQAGDALLSKLRVSATGTKGGKFLQKMTLDAEGVAARQALLQGDVSDKAAAPLIAWFSASPAARMAAGQALQAEQANLLSILTREKTFNLSAYDGEIHRFLENPELLSTAPAHIRRAVEEVWQPFFQRYESEIGGRINTLDPVSEFTPNENYFPRIKTQEGAAYDDNPASKFYRDHRSISDRDPLAGGKNFKARSMQKDDIFFGHKLTIDDLKSTGKLNDIANEGGFVGKFFETDISKVAPIYVQEYAREVGVLARHQHLVDGGFWKRAEDVMLGDSVIDKELIGSVKKNIATISDELKAVQKDVARSYDDLVKALEGSGTDLRAQLDDLIGAKGSVTSMEALTDAGRAVDDLLNGSLTISADTLQVVADSISGVKTKLADMFGAKISNGKIVFDVADYGRSNAVVEGALGHLDNLERDIISLRTEMYTLGQDAVGKELADLHTRAKNKLGVMMSRVEASRQTVEDVMEFGNQLSGAIARVASGEEIGDVMTDVADVMAILGKDKFNTAGLVESKVTSRLGVAGVLQDALRSLVNTKRGTFDTVTSSSKVLVDDVVQMSAHDFMAAMPDIVGGTIDLYKTRTMGIYALLRDERIYGEGIPQPLRKLRSELLERLKDADSAQKFLNSSTKGATDTSRMTGAKRFDTLYRDVYYEVTNISDNIESMDNWLTGIEERFVYGLDEVVDWSTVDYEQFPFLEDIAPSQYVGKPGVNYEELMSNNNFVATEPLTTADFARSSQQFRSFDTEGITYRQLQDRINQYREASVAELERPVQVGSGASGKVVSKQQLADTYRKVKATESKIREIRNAVSTRRANLKSELQVLEDKSLILGRQGKELNASDKARLKQLSTPESLELEAKTLADEKELTRLNDVLKGYNAGRATEELGIDGSVGISKDELSKAILNYTVVSEVVSRFNAVADIFMSHGMTPTQSLYGEVTNAVSAKFVPMFQSRTQSFHNTQRVLTDLDRRVAQAITESSGTGVSAGTVFKNALSNLSKKDRDALTEVIGSAINADTDAYTLFAGRKRVVAGKSKVSPGMERGANGKMKKMVSEYTLAENKFFEDHVRPWFEQTYPGRKYSKENAKQIIRTTGGNTVSKKRAVRLEFQTAFSDDAEAAIVKKWFEEQIGTSSIIARTTRQYRVVGAKPIVETRLRALKRTERDISRLLAPDMNVSTFLDEGITDELRNTPTLFARLIDGRVDALNDMIGARRAGGAEEFFFRTQAEEVGQTVAEKTATRQALRQGKEGGLAPIEGKLKTATNKTEAYSALESSVSSAKEQVATLREEAQGLVAKKRTKAGLNKKETARLEKLRRDVSALDKKIKKESGDLAKLPKPTPAERAIGATPMDAKRLEARRILGEYNRKMESPLFSKAQGDQEIVTVLESLAHTDLSQFKNGFAMGDGTYASFKNGERIIFTPDEWGALYEGGDRVARSAEIRSFLASSAREVGSLKNQMNDLDGAITTLESQMLKMRDTRGFATRLKRLQGQRSELADRFEALKIQREEMSTTLRYLDAGNFNSAMEKIRVLTHETADGPSVLGGKNLDEFLNGQHPAITNLGNDTVDLRADNLAKELDTTVNEAEIRLEDAKKNLLRAENFSKNATLRDRAAADAALVDAQDTYSEAFEMYRTAAKSVQEHRRAGSVVTNKADVVVNEAGEQSRIAATTVNRKVTTHASTIDLYTAGVQPEMVAARKRALQAQWGSSPEYKFLQEVAELEKNIYVKLNNGLKTDINLLTTHRDELVSLREQARAAYELDHPLEGIQRQAGRVQESIDDATNALMTNTGRFVPASGDKATQDIAAAESRIVELTGKRDALRVANKGKNFTKARNDEMGLIDAEIAKLESSIEDLRPMVERQMDVNPPRTMDEARQYAEDVRNVATPKGPLAEVSPEALGAAQQSAAGDLIRSVKNAERVQGVVTRAKASIKEWGNTRNEQMQQLASAIDSRVAMHESTSKLVEALRSGQGSILSEMATTLGLPLSGFAGPDDLVNAMFREIYAGRGIAESLSTRLDEISGVVSGLPDADAKKLLNATARGKAKPEQIETALSYYRKWVDEYTPVFETLSSNPDDLVARAYAAVAVGESRLIDLQLTRSRELMNLWGAEIPVWKEEIITPFMKGYEAAAKSAGLLEGQKSLAADGLYGLYGNEEAIALLGNISRIKQPGVVDDIAQLMRGYTGFFRSYATLSPGFHIRNGISNVFSMFAAGADVANMKEGFRLWRLLDDELKRGGTLQSFADRLPAEQREFGLASGRIMLGLGNSKTADALDGFARVGNTIRDNKLIDLSRSAGNKMEGSSRFMLAYDSLVKGMNDAESFNRTRRFLIDYTQKTMLDKNMRDIVPFWTWMSRNLPLQVINRWTNPKAYLMYDKFRKNFSAPNEEGEVTPDWISKQMGINLGGGNYLTPDLPFSRVDQQITDLADPRKLMSYVNPGIRVPLELAMNSNSFTGRPFKDEFVPVTGIFKSMIPMLAATGQLEYDSSGRPVMRQKAMYALMNLIPPAGRVERLFPSEDAGSKQTNAVAGFFGAPMTSVDSTMQDNERWRRLAQLQAMQNRRQQLGE